VSGDVAALRAACEGGAGALAAPALAALAGALAADALPSAWDGAWPDGPSGGGVGAWMAAVASRRRAALARAGEGAGAGAAAALLLRGGGGGARLGHFFSPRGLLTALRQASARALAAAGVPDAGIASLRLAAAWGAHAEALLAPLQSLCGGALPTLRVGGLALAGGGWDSAREVLVEAAAEAPEAAALPAVVLAWVPPGVPDPLPAAATVALPLFAGRDRGKPLAELAVPTGAAAGSGAAAAAAGTAERNKWALAGAALLVGEAEL
jgi:hypothetical protein